MYENLAMVAVAGAVVLRGGAVIVAFAVAVDVAVAFAVSGKILPCIFWCVAVLLLFTAKQWSMELLLLKSYPNWP